MGSNKNRGAELVDTENGSYRGLEGGGKGDMGIKGTDLQSEDK